MNERVRKSHEFINLVVDVVVAEEVVCGFVRVYHVSERGRDGGHEHPLSRVALPYHGVHGFDVDVPGDDSADRHDDELPKKDFLEVEVGVSRRCVDSKEREDVLDKRASCVDINLELHQKCPLHMDEELFLGAELDLALPMGMSYIQSRN